MASDHLTELREKARETALSFKPESYEAWLWTHAANAASDVWEAEVERLQGTIDRMDTFHLMYVRSTESLQEARDEALRLLRSEHHARRGEWWCPKSCEVCALLARKEKPDDTTP